MAAGGACAAIVALGIAVFAYIRLRAITDPEPPLFYAHPDTWERFRYLVFAEQFHNLFTATSAIPLGRLRRQVGRCRAGPRAPVHRARLADRRDRRVDPGCARRSRTFAFLALLVIATSSTR